jgi:hypothetical protein
VEPETITTDTRTDVGGGGAGAHVALAEAEQLVARGQLVEAVDLLAEADRTHRHPAIEIRLVDLRHAAARSVDPGGGRAPWPPAYADPFPDVAGQLPEISATELTTDALGGTVAHHGCLIVRGLFDAERVARTIAAVDRASAADEAQPADDGGSDAWYRPFSPIPNSQLGIRRMVLSQGGVWLADSPASTAQVLDDLAAVGVTPLIAEHFGERPFFSLQKSTLRRSAPVNKLTGWHQDGSFIGSNVRTMNVWLALTPCGGDLPTPGIKVVPRRFDDLLPTDGDLGPNTIAEETVQHFAASAGVIYPLFGPGDAMMFDDRFLHSTHLTPNMIEPRYALECWFFAGSHRSPGYVPFLA